MYEDVRRVAWKKMKKDKKKLGVDGAIFNLVHA
jgi:hypothetical protein